MRSYPTAQITFGAGSLIGHRTWHSGSNIHVTASAEPPPGRDGATKPKMERHASAIKRLVGALDTTKAFQQHDADASGTLSKDELAAALAAAGVQARHPENRRTGERAETRSDGP